MADNRALIYYRPDRVRVPARHHGHSSGRDSEFTLALLNRSLSARGGAVHRMSCVADRRSGHLLLIRATKRLVRVSDPWRSWSVRFWTYAPPPTFFIEVVLGDPCATSEVRGWAARNEAAAFPRIREEPLSTRLADCLHSLMTSATEMSFHRLAYYHIRRTKSPPKTRCINPMLPAPRSGSAAGPLSMIFALGASRVPASL